MWVTSGSSSSTIPVGPFANSCVVVFPITIAPARLSRSTQSASRVAIRFTKWRELAVVGRPRTSIMSFTAIGTPCSGPRSAPAANSRSAAAAAARAPATSMVTNALIVDCELSASSMAIPIKSADVTRRARRSAARSVMVLRLK